jgi:integrase
MANKKISGIKKVGDREYEIDKIAVIDGKRIHIRKTGFASVSEARNALPGIIEAKRKELTASSSEKSFDALCDQYEDYRSTQAKCQTIEALHYTIGKHILPTFSGLRVYEALTFDRVSKWYFAKCNSTADSAARKNKVFAIMRQLVDCAWKWHYITSETHQDISALVQNVRLPNRAKDAKGVWTYEDEEKFLASIPKDSIDYPMFSLFCYLGCRLGEFQGLQWKCLDAKSGSIVIGQQVVRLNGGMVLTPELKTNESYRVNQLDDATLQLLLKYRATLNSSNGDEYIFPSPHNPKEPLSRSEFRRRFAKYIELSGVPKIVPHGVRHSKATMIAGVCQNAEEVAVGAKFLGHSASMFMGTYVAQNGVSQSDILNRLKKR